MTTPATGRKLTSACNGVTKAFNCPVFQLPADLNVYLLNAATDANSAGTLLVNGVDYVISGDGPSGNGVITTTIAYPNGKYIRRWRKTNRAQGIDIITGQGLPAATQEGALDRLSLIDEELDDDIATVSAAVVPVVAASSIMGNASVAPAVAAPLTGQQVAALLPAFTADAGGNPGIKGLVPASTSGDAAANKFLAADGTWKVPPAPAVPVFTGDTGAGGVAGSVPAPPAGSASAQKYLKADGSWAVPAGGGSAGTTSSLLTFNNGGAGVASGGTFDGSVARTISWNTIGAAPINSPALTGSPTGPTPTPGDNSTKLSTTAFVAAALAALVNSSPAALDTLKELADALGDDANFATTMTTALAGKAAARPTIVATHNASYSAADGDNNSHQVLSGAGTPTLTLGNITAGTSFTTRATTAWAIACAGGLSKNGAAPAGVTTGAMAANKLYTFLHEGAGVWVASSDGLT